jgi:1,4-dihydroxy-6-naphthoate synthase
MQQISIAISPCPNDTFIFEEIHEKRLTLNNIEFKFHFLDIAELNQAATQCKFDVIKISTAHYKHINKDYTMLRSGGAMGFGVGPLLVKKENSKSVVNNSVKIAIPGFTTTANFLLKQCYPEISETQKHEIIFSDIEDAVLQQQFDFGVLIHEGRFTYATKGLALEADMGELWHQKTNLPIPLGCIVAKNILGNELILQIEHLIQSSIKNFDNNGEAIISEFIKLHAQDMDEKVMQQHINLYVNEFSKDMGNMDKLLSLLLH